MSLKGMLGLACGMLLAFPTAAHAATALDVDVPGTVSVVTGVGSLLIAGMLLLVVVQLRRVAVGSAIADHVSYVAAASLCLVASVLLGWVARFVDAQSTGVVRAGADLLLMVSILLFAVYFSRVKRSLSAFLSHLHSHEELAEVHAAEAEEGSVA